jgi:hypothetical protein
VKLILFACFFAPFWISGAWAGVIVTDNFTILDIVGGPYAGDTFTGTFTYDAEAMGIFAPLLSFDTDFPSWAGASLADATNAFFCLDCSPFSGLFNPGLNFFYAPGPPGNPDAFEVGIGILPFAYGETLEAGSAFGVTGQGMFTINPEPRSAVLVETGLIGLTGSLLRKRMKRGRFRHRSVKA